MDKEVQDRIIYHSEAIKMFGQDCQTVRIESIENIMKRHKQMLKNFRNRNMITMMMAPINEVE